MKPGRHIRVEILPYHGLGFDKYTWLDRHYALPSLKTPGKDVKEEMNQLLEASGCRVVR